MLRCHTSGGRCLVGWVGAPLEYPEHGFSPCALAYVRKMESVHCLEDLCLYSWYRDVGAVYMMVIVVELLPGFQTRDLVVTYVECVPGHNLSDLGGDVSRIGHRFPSWWIRGWWFMARSAGELAAGGHRGIERFLGRFRHSCRC